MKASQGTRLQQHGKLWLRIKQWDSLPSNHIIDRELMHIHIERLELRTFSTQVKNKYSNPQVLYVFIAVSKLYIMRYIKLKQMRDEPFWTTIMLDIQNFVLNSFSRWHGAQIIIFFLKNRGVNLIIVTTEKFTST